MKTVTLEVEVTEQVYTMLQRCVDTGLYGRNVEEAAERLICHELETLPSIYGYDDHEQPRCSASKDGRHFPGCGCP